jgi:hypothetical protein
MKQPYRYTRTRVRPELILMMFLLPFACGLPYDLLPSDGPAVRYDNLPDKDDEDAVLADYQALAQWDKLDLTYIFITGTDRLEGEREEELVREAFALWAAVSPLTFSEISNSSRADIVIGWATGDHGVGEPFDGPGDVLAHASYPNPYTDRQVFLFFDDDERWVDSDTQNVDLLTVAVHEIGHTLGLGHSNDPQAIMFPSYGGPRRALGQDDIEGIQALYGADSRPQPAPEAPAAGATPPPSGNVDTDGDGISDKDEVFRTGTDPAKKDSDGDGLGDGVEVINRMNPLDPDMDKDGVSDGQEVTAGTNPFFPDQAGGVSPELQTQVSEFLTRVIELQIRAYREGDATLADSVLAGDIYGILETNIDGLNRQGLVQLAEIDYYKSHIDGIRVVSSQLIEVNSCEVWSTAIYRRSDGALVESNDPVLLPQTITIEKIGSNWFVTGVQFFDAPAFCR